MPKNKKANITDKVEIQPTISEDEEFNSRPPVSIAENKDIVNKEKNKKITENLSPERQAPVAEIPKEKFKQLHIEDTYWLENDIYQTIRDMTEGKKNAKALIINQALKDYLKNNNMEITPLRVKGKKD